MKRTSNQLEKRSYLCEVRATENEEGGSIITGRPIVFESETDLGEFSEIIHRGALDHTDLKDVRFLINHDLSRIPLARSRRNNEKSTMQLSVDKDGMSIRVSLDTKNNADARSLYSAVQRGDISGMSFMFGINSEEWENLKSNHPIHHIQSISTVVEVSAVTFPAYESTEILARHNPALESAGSALESARRSAGISTKLNALELEKLKAKYLYNLK